MSFQLLSHSFAEGGWIPELHSCKGADLSPSLEWSGEPRDVRSFALVIEDPDAPSGTSCHWLVYDIPPDVHNMAQGLKPGSVGVSGTNDFGRTGYGGNSAVRDHSANRERRLPGNRWPGKSAAAEPLRQEPPCVFAGGTRQR